MVTAVTAVSPARRIKQPRGRRTYDALIETGFKLLEQNDLESIPIAELAKAAGYSVGAFYARFESKDEFFEAMIAHHLEALCLRERCRHKFDIAGWVGRCQIILLQNTNGPRPGFCVIIKAIEQSLPLCQRQ